MTGPLFSPEEEAAVFAALGTSDNPIWGTTEQQLLQQLLVVLCNS
jgi:hypothetical protein